MQTSQVSKLLLVEDNESNRDMLSRRLVRRGFEVVTATDGESAITIAREVRPDLVLMDMSLPGINGWDATRILKSSPETSAIPIVALTAHAMSSDREEAFAAGCSGFETKPVELDKLLATITELLAGRRGI
jgi:CheY-like chemotaxis protein